MKKLLIFILLSGYLFGAIPSSGGGTAGDKTSAKFTEPTLEQVGDVSNYQQKINATNQQMKESVLGGSTKAGDSFFEPVNVSNCESSAVLKCPPLKGQFQGAGYVTMIDYINPKEGTVSCTVWDNSNDIFNTLNGPDLGTPLASETIKIRACEKKFSIEANRVTDQATENLREISKNRNAQLNNIANGYQDISKIGGKTYMDLGDWLDALVTIDGSRIDIQSSLAKGEIQTTPKYSITAPASILSGFTSNVKSLLGANNLTPAQIDKIIQDNKVLRDRNKNIANSQYVMFMGFFVEADKAINTLLSSLVAAFIIYNALIQWGWGTLSHKLTGLIAKEKGAPLKENHIHRFTTGVFIIIFFFSGSINKYEVKSLVTGASTEMAVKEQRVRDVVRFVFSVSNDLADELARIGISQYLKYITLTSGISGIDRIDSYTSERQILQNENKILSQVEAGMCSGTYNTAKYEEIVVDKFAKAKEEKVVATEELGYLEKMYEEMKKQNPKEKDMSVILQLKINPYAKSEKVFFQNVEHLELNPYSGEAGILTGVGNNFMSFSGCYNNRNKMLENNQRLNELDGIIKQIKDDFKSTNSLDRVKSLYEVMWKSYNELGYLSVAFLPATAVLVDSQGVLGDKTQRDSDNMSEETMDMQLARAIPMLALFGGENIKKMVEKTINYPLFAIKETYNASAVGAVLNKVGVGGVVNAAATGFIEYFTYYTTYQIINSLLNGAVIVLMVVGGILAFIMLTLQKLYVFISVIFLAIWAFHPQQTEKILSAVTKVMTVSFKTVLLVVSMFLLLFSMSLLDSLQYRLINDFFVIMESTGGMRDTLNPVTIILDWFANMFQPYVFYGLAHIIFILAKVYLIYIIIFKLPGYFIEIIDSKAEDLFDKATDKLSDVAQAATTKGL